MDISVFLILVLVIILFVRYLGKYLWKTYRLIKLDLPTLPDAYPLVGIIPSLLFLNQQDRFKTIRKYSGMFTGLTKAWTGPVCFIVVNEPRLVSEVLTSDKCWSKARLIYDQVPFGDGLFTVTSVDKWRLHRRIFSYSFTRKNLINFVDTFVHSAEKMVRSLEPDIGKTLNIYEEIIKCTLDFHLATLMKAGNVDDNTKRDWIAAIKTIDYGMVKKFELPYLYPSTLYKLTSAFWNEFYGMKTIVSILTKLTSKYKKSVKEYSTSDSSLNLEHLKNKTLIDQVVYYEQHFTQQQVIDHFISFVNAFNTVGLEITQCVLMLAMHPEVQEKVYQEIKEVYPTVEDKIDYESVHDLKYMEQVINETLRLFPSIPFILRYSSEELELDGHKIPEGVNFFISIFSLHRNKDFWGESADQFNPENFSKENLAKVPPSAFIPFSLGKRNCIGKQYSYLSMKIVLKTLLENYTLSTHLKYEDIILINDLTLKLSEKPWIQLQKREV